MLREVARAGSLGSGVRPGQLFHPCRALLCDLWAVPASSWGSSTLSTKGGDWLRYEAIPWCLWSTCLAHVSWAHRLTRLMPTFLPA